MRCVGTYAHTVFAAALGRIAMHSQQPSSNTTPPEEFETQGFKITIGATVRVERGGTHMLVYKV